MDGDSIELYFDSKGTLIGAETTYDADMRIIVFAITMATSILVWLYLY